MFCLVGKYVFEPDFAMYRKKHTSLYRKLLGVPRDDYCFERLEGFWLVDWERHSPRTERWENTLLPIPHASQSFDHNGILLKINGNKKKIFGNKFLFPIRGKITRTISQKAFSLPISPRGYYTEDGVCSRNKIQPERVFSSLKIDLGDKTSSSPL